MHIGLHEGRIGPLVHIAQCRYPNSRLIVWRQLEPSLIDRGGLAEQMPLGEKTADAAIENDSCRIGDIALCVGPIFLKKPRIGGGSDVAGGEVGKQRVLAKPAITVTDVALRLAAE